MGECGGWSEGEAVTVKVEARQPEWGCEPFETLRVPGDVLHVYEAEGLVDVKVGGTVATFPFSAAEVDQSGRVTLAFTDWVAPE